MGLLLLATAALILIPLDHHAPEYDPYHEHILLTASGTAWTVAAPPHAHDFATAHRHGAPAPGAARPGAGEQAGIRAVSVGGLSILTMTSTTLALPRLSGAVVFRAAAAGLAAIPLAPVAGTLIPPADPPPRGS